MLKGITWPDYFTTVAVLAVAWYLIVTLLYCRSDIAKILSGKYKLPIKLKKNRPDEADQDNEPGSSFEELEGIVEEIRHSILEKAGKGADKAELLRQLQKRLANYGGLRQPAFRHALNNFIIQQAENICGVLFDEQELNAAWEALPR